MSYKEDLTQEVLLELFEYCAISGNITRKATNKIMNLSDESTAKIAFRYKGKPYKIAAHSIVWCYLYGHYPDEVIFHKDFNAKNIRMNNLMLVSVKQNYALISAYKNLTMYCDIKLHSQDKHLFLVRYLSNNRLKYERYTDFAFAQKASIRLKNTYRRLIITNGAIPPN